MTTFDYSADDERGRPRSGRITAPTWNIAQDALRDRGWIVRTLQLASEDQTLGGEDITVTDAPHRPSPLPPRHPLSLVLSLQALAEELPAVRGREALASVARRLEQGQPLSQAVHDEEDRLPADLRGLIALGLPSGRVDFLINDYLEHCRSSSDLRRSFRVSLAYPICLLAILIGILLFLFVSIVPLFAKIFEDFNTQLPGLTVVMVWTSSLLSKAWPWILIAIVVGPLAGYGLLRALAGPGAAQSLWRSVPVLGQGFRWASLSNFCQLLATLMELEIPLPQALRAASDVTDDFALSQGARRAATAIERGLPPREAVCQRGLALAELGAAFHWADRGGDFVESLRASGEVFSARSRVQTNLVLWMFEPVILCLTAISVGLIVLALFLPLIKLLNDLS